MQPSNGAKEMENGLGESDSSSDSSEMEEASFESASDDESDPLDHVDISCEPMEVMVKNFMAATPADHDRDGIENLLKQLFKYFDIDVKEFANILIEQNYATTVLKEEVDDAVANADEDSDEAGNVIYGVYGAVNLQSKKDNHAVKQFISFILTNAEKQVDGDFFKEVLNFENETNPHKPAFLIKEKVINIPGVAVGPLMKQLLNDMVDAKQKGMPYDFTHYIHVAKMIRIKNKPDYFIDQDDELIDKYHSRKFDVEYPSSIDSSIVFQNETGSKIHGKGFRRIYIISAVQLQQYMTELSGYDAVRNLMEEAENSGLRM